MVRRFKAWPKYLRNLAIFAALCLCSSFLFFIASSLSGSRFLYDGAWALLEISVVLFVVNLVLVRASGSPLEHLDWDARRELGDFFSGYQVPRALMSLLHTLEKGELQANQCHQARAIYQTALAEFKSIKAGSQVVRAGSKELGLLFWSAERVLIAEKNLLDEVRLLVSERSQDPRLRKRSIRTESLYEVSKHYTSVKFGQLPLPPTSPDWRLADATIQQYISSSQT